MPLSGAGPPTVLLVDDDPFILSVLAVALSEEGLDVVTCPDAPALAALARPLAVDLVVLDAHMPDLDFALTVANLRRGSPSRPILVMSGDTVPPSSMPDAPSQFLAKPFDATVFLSRVHALLGSPDNRVG